VPPPLIATAAKGTEDLCAKELKALKLHGIHENQGAVAFRATLLEGLSACLQLRTALRVLMPLAQLPAPDADGLYESLRTVPWTEHLSLSRTFAIEVTGKSPGLPHSLFAAQRAKDAIADTFRQKLGGRPSVDTARPDVRVVVHLHDGKADLSLDLAGESLHRRGYRRAPHPASLKETLAASLLLASGYDGELPLLDPMCGAGTIAIEAALIAERRAPNVDRPLGAERWPSFTPELAKQLAEVRAELRAKVRRAPAPILASDRDPEAVAASRSNARAARVQIQVAEIDAREVPALSPPGLVLCNPPYGGRVGGGGGKKQLKSFYHALGEHFRGFAGHTVGFLAGASEFESAFGLRPRSRRKLFNGPLPCELLLYEIRGQ
jgi:23S rRNA (guanine2445-N2)-methyltransferase / 23S rRNA (guanine2069-N7)-methyltransferase